MYDEEEYFSNFDSPLFNYPYTPRKNIVSTVKYFLYFGEKDYELFQDDVYLRKSTACLHPNYMA